MTTVTIIVLPGKYRTRELTSVSFLGPILEKTALEIILANKPVAVTTTYQHDLKYTYSIDKKEKPFAKNDVKEYIDTQAEDNIARILDMAPPKSKEIPKIITKTSSRDVYSRSASEISGPVSIREVIYRPEKPELPSWIDAGPPFKLEFEFIVSAQGEVKEVIPVTSCGNPEVDLIGMRYLKSWRFVPLAQESDIEQKGRARFIFEGDQ